MSTDTAVALSKVKVDGTYKYRIILLVLWAVAGHKFTSDV